MPAQMCVATAAAGQPAPGGGADGLDGYVDDDGFPSLLDRRFVPAWIDAILAQRARPAPRTPRAPFTYIDLGCGDGVGLVLLAAAYPEARFIGVDALSGHVARGRDLAAEARLGNVTFHCATFAEAGAVLDVAADYVALRGVVTW